MLVINDIKKGRLSRLATLANTLAGLSSAFAQAVQSGYTAVAYKSLHDIADLSERGIKLCNDIKADGATTESGLPDIFMENAKAIQQIVRQYEHCSRDELRAAATAIAQQVMEIAFVTHYAV